MPFEGLEAPHAPENPSDSGARAKPPPRARVAGEGAERWGVEQKSFGSSGHLENL